MRIRATIFSLFLALTVLLISPGCALLYPPPTTIFVFPFAELSTDSIDAPDPDALADSYRTNLQALSVGVLTNPNRAQWNSPVENEAVDERIDENVLLAEYLRDKGVFDQVLTLVDPADSRVDFVLSCSVECLYTIELDSWMFAWNCLTLGFGFLLGWPHQDPSAYYVAQAVFYDNRTGSPEIVAGSLVTNYKEWYCDNIYWRPDFYELSSLEPLFDQIYYDFLTRSGCLQ